ncbi:MAG: putative Ig domain-containing protein [Planctomycetota bacterium]
MNIEVLDEDTSDTHTFEILGQSQAWFEVKPDSTGLQVAEDAVIDFESNSTNLLEIRITDSGGADVSGTITVTANDINDAPQIDVPIPDMEIDVDTPFTYTVPLETFSDQDAGDSLIYSATNGTGFSLPSWISFDRNTRSFSGTPSSDEVGDLEIRVNAIDTSSAITFDLFTLTIVGDDSWHNSVTPTDVSGDANTSAIDALIMIDILNTIGAFEIDPNQQSTLGFADVSNDGFVSALDALLVIAFLNTPSAEGEFAGETLRLDSAYVDFIFDEVDEEENDSLLQRLAIDILGR